MTDLKQAALEQQAEPVPHAVIVGALFDFMGWLTTRKERLVLSGADEAGPAVDAIKVFAEMRGLSLDDARVQDWQNYTTQQQAEPVGDEWTSCMKLPIVVHVRQQRPGEEHVSTREGITPVKPDDLIMRGVSGEEYPIGRAIFEQTYSLNTTPPQRQWVGLTDEEILRADPRFGKSESDVNPYQILGSARDLEAKLKERNT